MNQRRRLAALSELMESRLVLSPTVTGSLDSASLVGSVDDSDVISVEESTSVDSVGGDLVKAGRIRRASAGRAAVEEVKSDEMAAFQTESKPEVTFPRAAGDAGAIIQIADAIHPVESTGSTARLELKNTPDKGAAKRDETDRDADVVQPELVEAAAERTLSDAEPSRAWTPPDRQIDAQPIERSRVKIAPDEPAVEGNKRPESDVTKSPVARSLNSDAEVARANPDVIDLKPRPNSTTKISSTDASAILNERTIGLAESLDSRPVDDVPAIPTDLGAGVNVAVVTKNRTDTKQVSETEPIDSTRSIIAADNTSASQELHPEDPADVRDAADTSNPEQPEVDADAQILPAKTDRMETHDDLKQSDQQCGNDHSRQQDLIYSASATMSATAFSGNVNDVRCVIRSTWKFDSNPASPCLLKNEPQPVLTQAAFDSVFGDATRLGLMLAAINHAGRRSGSWIAFADSADDGASEGPLFSKERRRRRAPVGRRAQTSFDILRQAINPETTIEERVSLPCAAPSCDTLFGDASMMTILFQETDQSPDGNQAGKLSLFGGLLLGTAALAAKRANQLHGQNSKNSRRQPATPRYSGNTVVFAE